MADLSDIREGIAANAAALIDVDPPVLKQVSAYQLDSPTPPAGMVAGLEPDGLEYVSFGGPGVVAKMRYVVLFEVCLGKASDVGSQKILNRLLAPVGATSLVAAIEAVPTLTARLRDDGTIDTGQTPAADDISFLGYRGQAMFTLPNGTTVLLATWAFEVSA